MRSCPACQGAGSRPWFTAHEDRFGAGWSGAIVVCSDCGCAFVEDPPAPDALSDMYSRYYSQYETLLAPDRPAMKLLIDRSRLARRIFRRSETSPTSLWGLRGPRALDFGCHDDRMLNQMLAQGIDAWGYDPHPKQASPRIVDGDREQLLARVGAVDDILVSHVLEHLVDPFESLQFLLRLLRPGGRIHIRVPNLDSPFRRLTGANWIHWHAPFHLQHFSPRSLDRLAARAGLTVVARRSYTPSDWAVGSLRAWLGPAAALPNRRLHRDFSTEMYLVARGLCLLSAPFGGDALEVIYTR